MDLKRDGNGSAYIEFEQAKGHRKRAWIQRKTDSEKDWAKAKDGRYLNIVRVDPKTGNPAGNATDFPIFTDLADEQILTAFVSAACAITGCKVS